jgi:CRP-like cAMP-binding protein
MQKAMLVNAAYRLLTQEMSLAEAATTLARDATISRRQAYRYLAQARRLEGPIEVGEPARAITFKIRGDVIATLRAYASEHGVTMSEVVTRAITRLVHHGDRRG